MKEKERGSREEAAFEFFSSSFFYFYLVFFKQEPRSTNKIRDFLFFHRTKRVSFCSFSRGGSSFSEEEGSGKSFSFSVFIELSFFCETR